MADQIVRSPNSSGSQNAEPGPNMLTQARIYRGDEWGHSAAHVGKAASSPASLRRGDKAVPVQGGPRRDVIE